MSNFEAPPLVILATQEETLQAILNPEWMEDGGPIDDRREWRTKSVWLCELIEEISKTGYPYNRDVMRRAEKRLGISQQPDESSALSLLVYNAQKYRRHDNLVKEGYTPLTQEMVVQAHDSKKWIEIPGENILGGTVVGRYKPRMVGSTLYLVAPRKRKYAVRVGGQPARIVEA